MPVPKRIPKSQAPLALFLSVASVLSVSSVSATAARKKADDGPPWPIPVPGWKAPEPGEHPRLFFRRSDLPEIRRRAQTEDGKKIIKRLRLLLNGSDGETLPPKANPSRKATNSSATPWVDPNAPKPPKGPSMDKPDDDEGPPLIETPAERKAREAAVKAGKYVNVNSLPIGKVYTIWHAAGYGMLWQVTGEKKYADLGRKCIEMALDGTRDRDNRYSFIDPHGALRAGPSLGAIAMGYDLCYDGWDNDFQQKVTQAIAKYDQGRYENLRDLAHGARHYPGKNHWGGQVGGAAMALLAIWKEPGVDNERIETLMETNSVRMIWHLTKGFGDGGYYTEHHGPGGIASDTAFVPALQAWKVAGGRDFLSPRPNAPAITLIKAQELLLIRGKPWYPLRWPSSHGSGNFSPYHVEGQQSDRIGVSRAGQFSQGFGTVLEKHKPALLWVYNNIVEKNPATRTYDTVSPYPHRAALALVNWPIGIDPVNPEKILPRVHQDRYRCYLVTRNQWKDNSDIVVTMRSPMGDQPSPIMVWGQNMKLEFSMSPGPTRPFFRETSDGSVIISNPKGLTYVAVDFSGASGAELLVAMIGKYAEAGRDTKSSTATAKFHALEACGYRKIVLMTLQTGKPPIPRVEGDTIVVGKQTIKFDGIKFILGTMADGPPLREWDSGFVYSVEYEQKVFAEAERRAKEAAARHKEYIRKLEARFAEAERLIKEGKHDKARAIATSLLKQFEKGPYFTRANRLLRKISNSLMDAADEEEDEDLL